MTAWQCLLCPLRIWSLHVADSDGRFASVQALKLPWQRGAQYTIGEDILSFKGMETTTSVTKAGGGSSPK